MKNLKAWLALLLVFAAGFAGGSVATLSVARHRIQHAVQSPDYLRRLIERRVATRLRLDRPQRARLDDILRRTQGELRELRSEFQPRFAVILDRAHSEISGILTPEQRARFEEFQAENRRWWQPR